MFDFSSCLTNIACVTSDGHEYSYSDIKRLSDEFSNYIIPHTMMFIGCSNSLESLIAYISCMRYHIVPLLLNRDIDTGTLDNLVSVYRPQYLFFPQDRCAIFEDKEILLTKNGFSLLKGYEGIDILPKNLSLLLTTSGSTGSPKLVRLSEENLESNAYSIIKYLNITSSERAITSLPMYYSYGLSVINSHLLAGATLLLTDKSYIQRDFWNFATIENATSFAGVPFTYEILKKMRFEKFFPASIKYDFMESSSHHSIFFSVPPFDQYRLLMAKYRNGVMIRRVPFPIWANCPPSKKACSTGSFVCVRNAMARSAPMEEATTIASRSTPCRCRKSSTCRISSSLLTYFCPSQ